jgi:hypothetical protein
MRAAAAYTICANTGWIHHLCVSGKSEAMSGHWFLSLALHLFEPSDELSDMSERRCRCPEPGVIFSTSIQRILPRPPWLCLIDESEYLRFLELVSGEWDLNGTQRKKCFVESSFN